MIILVYIAIESVLVPTFAVEIRGIWPRLTTWELGRDDMPDIVGVILMLTSLALIGFTLWSYFGSQGPDDIMGKAATASVAVFAIYWLIRARLDHGPRQNQAAGLDNNELPQSHHGWTQTIDVAIWLSIFVASIIAFNWVCTAVESSDRTSLMNRTMIVAALLCFGYQGLGTRNGTTVGQKWTRVRIVSARTGDPLGVFRSALRTLLLLSPFYALLVLIAKSSSEEMEAMLNDNDPLLIASILIVVGWIVAVPVSISVRDLHGRGQGLLDLTTRSLAFRGHHVGIR